MSNLKFLGKTDRLNSGGLGILPLLLVLFIGLKLTDNIDWSWWWVLSPLWVPLTCVVCVLVVIGVCFAAAAVIKYFYVKYFVGGKFK